MTLHFHDTSRTILRFPAPAREACLSSGDGGAPEHDSSGRGAKALFVVDGNLRIHFSNRGAAALAAEGIGAGERFVVSDKLFTARLQTWFKRCHAGTAPEETRLPLATRSGRQVAVDAVHLAGAGMDLFVLTVDDPQEAIDRNLEEVSEACGLTPTEARMLALIVEGLDTIVAARRLGIAPTTARTHLQRLFAKTGTARQSELVRFVATYVEEAG